MSLVKRITGSNSNAPAKLKPESRPTEALIDGALDTLANILRVMGEQSFELEKDIDPTIFPEMCREFSCHVENGAGVPSCDIPASKNGNREWARIRCFFADRRKAESQFVTERLHDYRGVVDDLVSGLRNIGERDQNTENNVKHNLKLVEDAVGTGVMPEIRKALTKTIQNVTETFAEQKRQYEAQLEDLHGRMSNLRQDLVAVREEMKRDSLTSAYNRRTFDSSIEHSLNLHFIMNQPVTLVMLDLDNFKNVNDTHGHAAGDEVLQSVSKCLVRAFNRKTDIVTRYGGDEFAIILNDTSAKSATKLVDRCLRYVNDLRVPYASEDARISCSIGFTEIHEHDSIRSLIKRADRALYQAKADGRNKSEFAPAIEEPKSKDP